MEKSIIPNVFGESEPIEFPYVQNPNYLIKP